MVACRSRAIPAFLLAGLLIGPTLFAAGDAPRSPDATPQAAPATLDAFMARVLERRDEAWRKLHDYILDETERFELTGPGGVRLDGMRREFSWYVRDGYLIRSPLKYDGVAIPDADRRRYEEKWLKEEKDREARRAKGQGDAPRGATDEGATGAGQAAGDEAALQGLVDQRGEPRFISEAYFLKFKFEPGNYYLAGRERLDGRDVLRIEYYPTRLFGEHESRKEKPDRSKAALDRERQIERDLNKVALVTLWIDPSEYQIVRYTFDNIDFGFLPGRWLVRVDTISASMTMARVLDGVWLPHDISARAGLTLASGSYGLQYGREFRDYRKAETSAKIRSIGE
jgi:hypothetical protein